MIGNAAGHNQLEVAQVSGDVEGEAVRGDAARHVDTDGADFDALCLATTLVQRVAARRAPDTGQTRDAAGAHAVDAAEADEGFLHAAHKIDRAQAAAGLILQAAQVKDGIADKLAGAVVRHIAAAINLVQRNSASRQKRAAGQHVGAVGIAPQGQHRRMLQQQQYVAHPPRQSQLCDFGLQLQSLVVANAPEIEVLNHG